MMSCDCSDGSDEPGTAACPNGKFHCTNAGYRPVNVPSSRVNDGICDCCDATDEYTSGTVCANTCKELGKKERETLKQLAKVVKAGLPMKEHLIEEARKTREEKKRKLEKLQESQRALESEAEARRRTKEEAEALGQEAKEKHRSAWNELQVAKRKEQESQHVAKLFVELDSDHSGVISAPEVQARPELDGDAEGTVTETEARAILGGTVGVDLKAFQDNIWHKIKDKYMSAPVQVPDFDETTQAVIDAAEETRDDYRLTEKHLYQIKEDIRKLEEELSMDFGPHHEFVFMHRECYEITNEYVYKICPFHKVTQKSKQGGMETLLGVWGSWAGSEENKYSMMKFEDGAPCWQGPYRSVQVKLLCGEQTAVMSSTEPSRCEYLFELQTPAACNQPAPALKHEEL